MSALRRAAKFLESAQRAYEKVTADPEGFRAGWPGARPVILDEAHRSEREARRSSAVNRIGNTESLLREAVMTTPAGRRWAESFRRRLKESKRREARIARRAARPVEATLLKDEARAHGVKLKSFAADLKRKKALGRATPKAEVGPASGEISALLTEPESSTLGAGRPDGMRSRKAYCERCGESHATSACAAIGRRKAREAIARFDAQYNAPERDEWVPKPVRAELVEGNDPGWGMSGAWPQGDEQDASTTSKEESNYRYASDPKKSCGRCKFFREPAACAIVAGMILKTDTCDYFEPKGGRPMNDRVREAIAAFDRTMRGGVKTARDKIEERYARELGRARDSKERKEAKRRREEALRELEAREMGVPDYHQDCAPGPKPREDEEEDE